MHPLAPRSRRGSWSFPYRIDKHAVVHAPGGRLGVRAKPGRSPIPTYAKRTAAEPLVRALNRDLLRLHGRTGGDGSHATRGTAPPIRETVLGRDAGHGWGDDHGTRACDAIGSRPRNRRRRKPRAADLRENPASGTAGSRGSAGRGRAGRKLGWPERELDLGPGGAGGSVRGPGDETAAGPKPPDVVLGVWFPFPLPADRGGHRRRRAAARAR